MKFDGFIGQSYESASPAVDSEKSFNLFPEVISGAGTTAKSKLVLRRKPGLGLQQTLGDSPGRGKFAIDGRDFCVAGGSFYELTSPTTSVLRGSFPAGTSAVQFACNTTQILILADGLGYLFTLATNAFQQLTAGFPSNAISCCSIDTYFLVLEGGTNEFFLSGLLDGTTWSGVDFGSSQEPDNAVAIANLHLYLWIFGQKEIVLFQDSGNASFPFTRVPNSQIEQGCAATNSVAVLDNTLFWLGADKDGAAVVYRADGLAPSRISTHAVEAAMQSYATVSDAVAMTYQADGHAFYCLHFPTAGTCWVFDASGGMWHERGYWNTTAGTFGPELGRFHSYAFGKHLVADYTSGNIYELSRAYATDNGNPIRVIRTAPHLSDEEQWLFYSYIQVDMQVGDGLPSGATPQAMIRWSDDGGRTWRTPRQVGCGATGQYTARVKVNRCGRARNRVFEFSMTDPIPDLVLIAAYLGVSKGV